MAPELELLTVGRISIDLYCDQVGADWHAARRERGIELAIVKLGGGGVLLSSDEGERLIEPPRVQALCGLGAGDAFGGALAHGLLSGWSPERTVAFANAAGGIVASRLLCSQPMPYESEVVELLEGTRA